MPHLLTDQILKRVKVFKAKRRSLGEMNSILRRLITLFKIWISQNP